MGLNLKRNISGIVAVLIAGGFSVLSSTVSVAAGSNCAGGIGSWPCFAAQPSNKRVAKKTYRAKRALKRRSRSRRPAYLSRRSASYQKLKKSRKSNVVYLSRNGKKISRRRAAALVLKRRKNSKKYSRSRKSITRKSNRLRHMAKKKRSSYNKGFSLRGRHMRVASRSVRTSCFPARLKRLIRRVEKRYGKRLVVTSGYRSHAHNRRIGGAKRSQHIHCKAVDFRIPGVSKYSLARYVKSLPGVGGVGTYCGKSTIHMDVGPKRSWNQACGKRRSRKRYAKRNRSRRSYRTTSLRRANRKKWNFSF